MKKFEVHFISPPSDDNEEFENGICHVTGEKHNWEYVRRSRAEPLSIYKCTNVGCEKIVYVYIDPIGGDYM